MGCICCCRGGKCSACGDNTPLWLYASATGITPAASGVCLNGQISGVTSEKLSYTGSTQDIAMCIKQEPVTFCGWEYGMSGITPTVNLFTGTVPTISYYVSLGGGCAGGVIGTASPPWTVMRLDLSGNTYTFRIYLSNTIQIASAIPIFFKGSTTVSSPVLCRGANLSFTNSLSLGDVDSFHSDWYGGVTGFAAGTGGSASVIFKSSCCQ